MTQNQLDFFELLQNMHYKAMIFADQFGQISFSKENFKSIQNYFEELENEVDEVLVEISGKFNVSKKAAFVLGAIIHLYLKFDGIKTNFITFSDIERFFYLRVELFLFGKLREAIFELEEKNIIEITEVKHYLIRVLNSSDRQENEYYMLPSKPSFVPFANKKFELSPSTIRKINGL